ncbi:MarR family transcriptional regulator [Paenarthrobacter sp. Z7-10]|uniref:MarR family winged helix-turn-helix transcriptional regulator n=1 Tax=Paenarthrobacter sp. Z7-10 TaxID=2787635 RepID=UPI0022A8DCA2|nr:MarR family transcriptional regulator [Paenarthrobacter sp. Z7-10]MCZ2401915.1 MarR family transcriptional regulator [Paenarthrobacter sp. Z7-10]
MTKARPNLELLTLLQEFTVETERYVEQVSSTHALHRTDLNALAFLVQASRSEGPVTPGRLGEALNLSSPATTALVDRLDRAGHLTRRRSETDRRQVQLSMTSHAREVGSALFSPLAARLDAALTDYSPQERQLAERFMRDMVRATVQARSEIPDPGPFPSAETPPTSDPRSAETPPAP